MLQAHLFHQRRGAELVYEQAELLLRRGQPVLVSQPEEAVDLIAAVALLRRLDHFRDQVIIAC